MGTVELTCVCPVTSGVYDKNSWQETDASRKVLADLDKRGDSGALVVNGYGASTASEHGHNVVSLDAARLFMDDLKASPLAPLVPLDGIGATCILLRADLHREGLSFPSFPLNHAIESEGIAQMALKMGARVYGRTDIPIRHA